MDIIAEHSIEIDRPSDVLRKTIKSLKDDYINSYKQDLNTSRNNGDIDYQLSVLCDRLEFASISSFIDSWIFTINCLPNCQHKWGALLVLSALKELQTTIESLDKVTTDNPIQSTKIDEENEHND